MMRGFRTRTFSVLALLCLAGCGSPPDKEITQARAAIDAARTAGAPRYAPDEYRAAVTALDRARQAVAGRDYRQALSFALDSRSRAEDAQRNAGEQRRVARAETLRTLDVIDATLAEARRRVEAGPLEPQSRAERMHVSDLRRAIVVANVAMQEAREAVSREDYAAARQATFGVADHLRAVLESAPAPPARVR